MEPVATLLRELNVLNAKTNLTPSEQSRWFSLDKALQEKSPVDHEYIADYVATVSSAKTIELRFM